MVKENNTKRKYTTITIPAPLSDKIREIIKKTGFSSVSDYATYILREHVAIMEAKMQGKSKDSEDDKVVAKLRALGYI